MHASTKLRPNQHGFSPIVGIITVVVVIGLAFGGWYISQKQNDNKKANSNQTNSQTDAQKDEEKDDTNPIADSTEDGKYLLIKEWGLRIALPDQLKGDISYSVNDRAEKDFGGPALIDLHSKKFSDGDLKCAVIENSKNRTLVSFYKEVDGAGGTTEVPSPFKRISDTRYYLSRTGCEQAVEENGSQQDKQLLIDLKTAVTSSLENI